ncbi:MAG TPA: NAD(P)-binding domain-containing protein [Actinomycetota bacterium]|nr:NAD(P)-binding domain-containing protein [Actinomycetota bacterium]
MNGMVGSERFETVIIGGGQAGLSTGYHLAKGGRPFVILDANERIGDSWRKRWDSLRVFTQARYDGLPGWAFPAPPRSFPTKEEVADYLEAYAARFDLPVRTGSRVDRLSKEGDHFVVTAGDRRFEADNVVVATGVYQSAKIPAFASELGPSILQMHSTEYRNPAQFREGGVLVVGAGNSGAEIAVEASRDHPTWLSGRDTGQEPTRPGSRPDWLLMPLLWFMVTHVLTMKTPIGRKLERKFRDHGIPLARVKRKDIAAAGIERVPRVAGVREGLPVLEDDRVLEVANVIWSTGYMLDFRWIDLPVFDEDARPVHDRGVVGSEPGLYFIGLPFLYSLSSALIGGAGRDAEYIAKHIDARSAKSQSTEAPQEHAATGRQR